MALFHQIQQPEAANLPVKPREQKKLTVSKKANPRKQEKLTVSKPANELIPGQPCPCCGQIIKWDRKTYQRELMRKRRAADKETKK